MADVVLCCLCGVELMNVSTITHDTFSMSNVEIARYFVDGHLSIHSTPLTVVHSDELISALTNTLSRVAKNGCNAPLLLLVGLNQGIASWAAPIWKERRGDVILKVLQDKLKSIRNSKFNISFVLWFLDLLHIKNLLAPLGFGTVAIAARVWRVCHRIKHPFSNDFNTSFTNGLAVGRNALLQHVVFYVQLIVTRYIHNIQVRLLTCCTRYLCMNMSIDKVNKT